MVDLVSSSISSATFSLLAGPNGERYAAEMRRELIANRAHIDWVSASRLAAQQIAQSAKGASHNDG